MSKTSPKPKRRPAALPRLAIGAVVAIQIALAIVALVAGNYLSATHHRSRDLSRLDQFTLSSWTRKLLSSDLMTGREVPVKLIVAVRKSSKHYARIRSITEEYQNISGGKLALEFVDPERDADRAFEIAETYDYIFYEDVCIVDARPQGAATPVITDPNGKRIPSPHIRFIPVSEMIVYRSEGEDDRIPVGYQDENLITSSILGALEGTPRRIYFLADKSQLQDSSVGTPWATLSDTLRRQNVQLTPIRISDLDTIPADAEGLALVAPRYDLDEREMGVLREYWRRPRAALLVILDPFYRPERLRAFLREHGVTPRDDRILTKRDGPTSAQVLANFTYGAQLNRINTDLTGRPTVFEGGTSSLEVREGAEDLLNRRIFPIALIQTSAEHWGETRFTEENPSFTPGEDHGNPAKGANSPLTIGAAVIRGNSTSEDTAELTSRMVVLSNSSFLHPQRLRAEQVDFLHNSSNWLLGREDLIGIGPQPLARHKLNLIPSQVSFINRLNLFIIPGALLLVGLAIWNIRRA
jgi:hypothetical protein